MSHSKAVEIPTTERVWKEFAGRLREFLRKRIKNDADADDVLQEVFRKIHRGLGRIDNVSKLEAWVYQVTRRALLDHFRGHGRNQSLGADVPDLVEELPPSRVAREVASCLKPLLEGLSAQDREAIKSADLDGLTQKELAGRLGLSVTAIKSRVQRARRRLKAILLECCDIELDRQGNVVEYTVKKPGCAVCDCDSMSP